MKLSMFSANMRAARTLRTRTIMSAGTALGSSATIRRRSPLWRTERMFMRVEYMGTTWDKQACFRPVKDPNEIKPALQRAFDSGKPAVINAIVEPTAGGVSRAWGGSRMEYSSDALAEWNPINEGTGTSLSLCLFYASVVNSTPDRGSRGVCHLVNYSLQLTYDRSRTEFDHSGVGSGD